MSNVLSYTRHFDTVFLVASPFHSSTFPVDRALQNAAKVAFSLTFAPLANYAHWRVAPFSFPTAHALLGTA